VVGGGGAAGSAPALDWVDRLKTGVFVTMLYCLRRHEYTWFVCLCVCICVCVCVCVCVSVCVCLYYVYNTCIK
jgi:hypothetical protein